MKYQTVIWDFDGVWSKSKFYQSLEKSHPEIWNFIQTQIWGPNNNNYINRWMRAELNMNDINQIISQGTNIDFDWLTKILLEDTANIEIEVRHIPIVKALKKKGIKVGMVTNNMDIITTVTVPKLKLLDLFDEQVFNSFDHRMLKAEGLFDLALQKIGADYSHSLIIDDSPRARAYFESKGGHTYPYTTFDDFQIWANKNLFI
jgi:FMN phosphatase YigB (HAD superfamily)